MTTRTFFITGTDTESGKTLVGAGLLYKARELGLSTLGLKPVAAGAVSTAKGLRNDDAEQLIHNSSVKLPYDEVNPMCLKPPIAPHIAAANAGISISSSHLHQHCCRALQTAPDLAIVEGAGGWLVPLNDCETLADLARGLADSHACRAIAVIRLKLGGLNHSMLTVNAIRTSGVELAGWVANCLDEMPYQQDNLDYLHSHIDAPCLGTVPALQPASAQAVAEHLNLDPIING